MKIREIRKITDAEKKSLSAGCGSTPGNGLDKPPC